MGQGSECPSQLGVQRDRPRTAGQRDGESAARPYGRSSGTDDEAPAVPERLDVEIHSDDYVTGPCDGWEDWARFEVGSAGFVDLMADDEQVFDSEEPDSPLVDMSLSGELAWSGRAQPGTELRVRFATLDVAGNFSGWSEVEPVPWPLAGCTCDAGGQAAGLALLPLLLLVARRRRGAGGVLLLLVLLALPTSASADPSHFAEDWARDLSVDAQEEARRLAIVGAVGTPLCATNAIFVGLRVPVAAELLPGCLIGFIPVWVAAASFSVLSRDVLRLGAATKGWAGLGIGFGVPMAVVGGVMAFLIPAATWTPEAAIPGLAISVAGHALIFSALGTVDLVTRYQAGARTINRPIALSPAGITIRF